MKKQFLLAIIPALLALSSCARVENVSPVKGNEFLEDTLAHDEVFGNVELEARALQPKRLDDPVEHPEANNFSIGVQSQVETEGHISFRFVAAVRFADSQLDPTQAVWSRTVSYTNGNVKKEFGTFPSAKAYKQISNGGGAYSIDDYNGAHSLTGDNAYTHFVVYTLRNVPVDSNDYYVSTYLTLSTKEGQSGGKELTSKAVAINASKTAKFVYDLGNNGGAFFLEGTINGSSKIVKASSIRSGNNKAIFSEVDFASGDIFVVKEFYNTDLYVHGSSSLTYEVSGNTGRCFENNGGKISLKASKDGNYSLYLNNSSELYTEDGAPYGVHNGFYIRGSFTNNFAVDDNYQMCNDRNNKAVFQVIHLNVGDTFKVWKQDGDVWYGWHDDKVSTDSSLFSDWDGNDHNIRCNTAGDYTVFLNGNSQVWVNPYVA